MYDELASRVSLAERVSSYLGTGRDDSFNGSVLTPLLIAQRAHTGASFFLLARNHLKGFFFFYVNEALPGHDMEVGLGWALFFFLSFFLPPYSVKLFCRRVSGVLSFVLFWGFFLSSSAGPNESLEAVQLRSSEPTQLRDFKGATGRRNLNRVTFVRALEARRRK